MSLVIPSVINANDLENRAVIKYITNAREVYCITRKQYYVFVHLRPFKFAGS